MSQSAVAGFDSARAAQTPVGLALHWVAPTGPILREDVTDGRGKLFIVSPDANAGRAPGIRHRISDSSTGNRGLDRALEVRHSNGVTRKAANPHQPGRRPMCGPAWQLECDPTLALAAAEEKLALILARIYDAYPDMQSENGSHMWNTRSLIGWDEPSGIYDHVPSPDVPPPDPATRPGNAGSVSTVPAIGTVMIGSAFARVAFCIPTLGRRR